MYDIVMQESGTDNVTDQSQANRHNRNQDALAAAEECFLERMKTKVIL